MKTFTMTSSKTEEFVEKYAKLAGSYSLQEIVKATQTKMKTLAERKIRDEGKSVEDEDILIVITGED